MQFRVVVPSHVKEGQTVRVRCPDGTEGDVKVPKGLKCGDSFVFEMPYGDSDSQRKSEIKGFLDREIVNIQDLAMALGVGMFIGFSIVCGFVLGVLTVTDPSLHAYSRSNSIPGHGGEINPEPKMRLPQMEL